MASDLAALLALLVFVLGIGSSVGLRAREQRLRTGTSGVTLNSDPPGTTGWWAQTLAAGGALTLLTGLVLVGLWKVGPPVRAAGPTVLGFVLLLGGVAGAFAAQAAMGASWRIGVDASERTALVTDGVFGLIRNPVYTALLAAASGVVLVVPTPVTLVGLALLVTGVELQVRFLEEPHLLATHGTDYADYAAAVGRFVPAVGRLSGKETPDG